MKSSLFLGASFALSALAISFGVENHGVKLPSCSRDDCFLALVDPRISAAASSFCVAYITPTVTATATATSTTHQTRSTLIHQTLTDVVTDSITSTVSDLVTLTTTATATTIVTASSEKSEEQKQRRDGIPPAVLNPIINLFGAARVSSVCSCLVTPTATKTVTATKSVVVSPTATVSSTIVTIKTVITTQYTVRTSTVDSLVTTTTTAVATTTPAAAAAPIPCASYRGREGQDLVEYCGYTWTNLTVGSTFFRIMAASDCADSCTYDYYNYMAYDANQQACQCLNDPGQDGSAATTNLTPETDFYCYGPVTTVGTAVVSSGSADNQ